MTAAEIYAIIGVNSLHAAQAEFSEPSPPGKRAVTGKITGKDEIRQHLAELGFVVDAAVMVVSDLGGNLIVQVKDSRIALDRGMANRILV